MRYPNFCSSGGPSQSPITNPERLVNLYVEYPSSPGARVQQVLYPTPGVTSFVSVTESPIRGIFAQEGRCWFVAGNQLYELFEAGTATARGDVGVTNDPVCFTTNGAGGGELFLTTGGLGYTYNLATNTLTLVQQGVTQCAMIDGYFLALNPTTSTLYLSDLNDGLTWDPTQFTQRSAASDPWRAMQVTYKEIWLMGEQTSEVWYNPGTFPFPFAPIPGALMYQGIAAPATLKRLAGAMMWVAQNEEGDRTVQRAGASGYDPQKVSSDALDTAMKAYPTVSDAYALTYQEEGHDFYILSFPQGRESWGFDGVTGQWHERGSWDPGGGRYDAWRASCHARAFNRHFVGDRESSAVFTMSNTVFTDFDGTGVRRVRRAPALTLPNMAHEFLRIHALEVIVDPGVGLATGQGSDPQMMCRISRDGGKSFGSLRQTTMGAVGNHETRVKFRRLGRARNGKFVPEIIVSDPVGVRITDGLVEVGI